MPPPPFFQHIVLLLRNMPWPLDWMDFCLCLRTALDGVNHIVLGISKCSQLRVRGSDLGVQLDPLVAGEP